MSKTTEPTTEAAGASVPATELTGAPASAEGLSARDRMIATLESRAKAKDTPAEGETPEAPATPAEGETPVETESKDKPKPDDDETIALRKQKRELAKRDRRLKAEREALDAAKAEVEAQTKALREGFERDPIAWLRANGVEPKEVLARWVREDTEDPRDKALREARETAEAAKRKAEELEKRATDKQIEEARNMIRNDYRAAFNGTTGDDYPFLHAFSTPEQVAEAALELQLRHYREHRVQLDPTQAFEMMEADLAAHAAKLEAAKKRLPASAKGTAPGAGPGREAASPETPKQRPSDVPNRTTRTRASGAPAHEPSTRNYFDKEAVKESLRRRVDQLKTP